MSISEEIDLLGGFLAWHNAMQTDRAEGLGPTTGGRGQGAPGRRRTPAHRRTPARGQTIARRQAELPVPVVHRAHRDGLSEGHRRGTGWPAFWIIDLDDPIGLEHARQVAPPGRIDEAIADAEARDVAPVLVLMRVLVEPYDFGENWWKDCPNDRSL